MSYSPAIMADLSQLSYAARDVRRFDRDRFSTVLFAPEARREALFALYAFNSEIARVREQVNEPMFGRIRLQWWRDTLGGLYSGQQGADHPTAAALAEIIAAHSLSKAHFDHLINAREQDLEVGPPETYAALEDYTAASSACLQLLALELLDASDELSRQAARHVGIAWALTGLLRSTAHMAGSGRVMLPLDMLDQHGVDLDDLLNGKSSPGLQALAKEMAGRIQEHLGQARRQNVRRSAIPALLCASLADGYLSRLGKAGYDLMDTRWSMPQPRPLRLAWKSLTGGF